ncbi:hypothetical protein JCM9279_006471 [Rhodotorula babjevae]
MLHQLPTDVLYRIFAFLVPPVSREASRSRHKILFGLGRISVQCARAAQMHLFEVVHLGSPQAAFSWCHSVETHPRARLLAQWRTHKVFISSGGLRMSRNLVERVFGTVPAVKELWLADLSCNLLSLSVLPQLTSCFMAKVDLIVELTTHNYVPYLRELRILVLSMCMASLGQKVIEFGHVLRAESFPKLTTLAVTWSKKTSDPEMHRLAKQLTHLFLRREPEGRSVRDGYPSLPDDELRRATALQHLSVDIFSSEDVDALEAIPVELSSLRITTNDACRATKVERGVLGADLECLDALSHLIVAPVDDDELDEREETIETCEALGCEVYEVPCSGKLEDFVDERSWLGLTGARSAHMRAQRPGARSVVGAAPAAALSGARAST